MLMPMVSKIVFPVLARAVRGTPSVINWADSSSPNTGIHPFAGPLFRVEEVIFLKISSNFFAERFFNPF